MPSPVSASVKEEEAEAEAMKKVASALSSSMSASAPVAHCEVGKEVDAWKEDPAKASDPQKCKAAQMEADSLCDRVSSGGGGFSSVKVSSDVSTSLPMTGAVQDILDGKRCSKAVQEAKTACA